jgi:CheY-like chemotaxis protein
VSAPAPSAPAAGGAVDLGALKRELKQEILAELNGMVAEATRPRAPATRRGGTRSAAALVCEDDKAFADSLVATLRGLGYEPEVVGEVAGAVALLERHDYAIVTVDQSLAGDPQGGLKVLEWINRRPGPERRRLFVAYVTSETKSMDTGSAFIAGSNLTVNKADAVRLPAILAKGLEERDELYRVFDEVTEAVAQGE